MDQTDEDVKRRRIWIVVIMVVALAVVFGVSAALYFFVFDKKTSPSSAPTSTGAPSSRPPHHSRPPSSGQPPSSSPTPSAPPSPWTPLPPSSVPAPSAPPSSIPAPSAPPSSVPATKVDYVVGVASCGQLCKATSCKTSAPPVGIKVQGSIVLQINPGPQPSATFLGKPIALTVGSYSGTPVGYLGVLLTFQKGDEQTFSHKGAVVVSYSTDKPNESSAQTLETQISTTLKPYYNIKTGKPVAVNGFLPRSLAFCVYGDVSPLWKSLKFQLLLQGLASKHILDSSFETMTPGFPAALLVDLALEGFGQGVTQGTLPPSGAAVYTLTVQEES